MRNINLREVLTPLFEFIYLYLPIDTYTMHIIMKERKFSSFVLI